MLNYPKTLVSAAHLVAEMRDPNEGLAADSLPLEVRDSLEMLQEELDQAALLVVYKRDDGELGI
jgi:hypothetical protein